MAFEIVLEVNFTESQSTKINFEGYLDIFEIEFPSWCSRYSRVFVIVALQYD